MKTSVIVTTLNEEKTIAGLLDALIGQSHLPDEIVIVDGGSTDGTRQIIKTYAKQFPRLKIRHFLKRGTIGVGRNLAAKKAQHSLLAITDAGCVPDRMWLAELLKEYYRDRQPIVAGFYRGIPRNNFEEAVVPFVLVMPDKLNPDNFLPATRSMLIEKKVFLEIGGFNPRLKAGEDYDLALRLQKKFGYKKTFAFTQKAVVGWLPRSNLKDFAVMIFRMARGDAQAHHLRPSLLHLFGRYAVGIPLTFLLAKIWWSLAMFPFIAYLLFAIAKNFRYASRGWFYLPTLQIVSDGAVMLGTALGLLL